MGNPSPSDRAALDFAWSRWTLAERRLSRSRTKQAEKWCELWRRAYNKAEKDFISSNHGAILSWLATATSDPFLVYHRPPQTPYPDDTPDLPFVQGMNKNGFRFRT